MFVKSALKTFIFPLTISKTFTRTFYDTTTRKNTIYAPITTIDTRRGSPLGVIRVSGSETSYIIKRMTISSVPRGELDSHVSKSDSTLNIRPREARLLEIIDPNSREIIDKGLVIWFPGPRSYTGEDCCEFHLHGSQAVMSTMLSALSQFKSVRPAEPGEFTRRAVENGKMSLVEAEGLHDLIKSKTDLQRRLALAGMDKAVQYRYNLWTEELVRVLAHVEATIDFGEDELLGEEEVISKSLKVLRHLVEELEVYIRESSICREFVDQGAKVVILGRPNSGKSTLMNILCRTDKSIVSDLSGTTRDVVEHTFQLAGHSLTLFDTAGLRDYSNNQSESDCTTDNDSIRKHESIEREGIRRAYEVASKADIIIYLVDAHYLCTDETSIANLASELEEVLERWQQLDKVPALRLVINKIDLNTKKQNALIRERLNESLAKLSALKSVPCFVSCGRKLNLESLVNTLASDLNRLASGKADSNTVRLPELNYINERHLALLKSALRHLKLASQLNLNTIDELAQHVRETVDYLSRIVGTVSNEEVLDVIFRDFCIGK